MEESNEEYKKRLQLQLDYAYQHLNAKSGIDAIVEGVYKANLMFGNITLVEALSNLEKLKDGELC